VPDIKLISDATDKPSRGQREGNVPKEAPYAQDYYLRKQSIELEEIARCPTVHFDHEELDGLLSIFEDYQLQKLQREFRLAAAKLLLDLVSIDREIQRRQK